MALGSLLQRSMIRSEEPSRSSGADEQDLIGRSQAGNVEAFNMLIEHHQHRVHNLCFRMLGATDADDATQEVFLSAFRGIRRYHGGSFLSWLLRIATNKCYDQLRARKRKPHHSLDTDAGAADVAPLQLQDPGEAPDDRLVRAELAQEIQRRLQELETDQRLVVILSDIQGYRYEEIVAATGWPIGTVKSRLSRGRARLRAILQSTDVRPAS
jgi:RNA polymerase sigma factor (sigma-70 family)